MSEGHSSESIVRIPLTRGQFAIVDKSDYDSVELLRRGRWYAEPAGRGFYAAKKITVIGRPVKVYMHALLMNPPKKMQVDHKDHDGLNNRRGNLRVCTPSQNGGNSRKKAGVLYKGVRQQKGGSWVAEIGGRFKRRVGTYRTPEEAARAYNAVALQLWGEFAYLNVIPDS